MFDKYAIGVDIRYTCPTMHIMFTRFPYPLFPHIVESRTEFQRTDTIIEIKKITDIIKTMMTYRANNRTATSLILSQFIEAMRLLHTRR